MSNIFLPLSQATDYSFKGQHLLDWARNIEFWKCSMSMRLHWIPSWNSGFNRVLVELPYRVCHQLTCPEHTIWAGFRIPLFDQNIASVSLVAISDLDQQQDDCWGIFAHPWYRRHLQPLEYPAIELRVAMLAWWIWLPLVKITLTNTSHLLEHLYQIILRTHKPAMVEH